MYFKLKAHEEGGVSRTDRYRGFLGDGGHLKDLIHRDIALYQHFNKSFWKQVEQEQGFFEEVAEFKAMLAATTEHCDQHPSDTHCADMQRDNLQFVKQLHITYTGRAQRRNDAQREAHGRSTSMSLRERAAESRERQTTELNLQLNQHFIDKTREPCQADGPADQCVPYNCYAFIKVNTVELR